MIAETLGLLVKRRKGGLSVEFSVRQASIMEEIPMDMALEVFSSKFFSSHLLDRMRFSINFWGAESARALAILFLYIHIHFGIYIFFSMSMSIASSAQGF